MPLEKNAFLRHQDKDTDGADGRQPSALPKTCNNDGSLKPHINVSYMHERKVLREKTLICFMLYRVIFLTGTPLKMSLDWPPPKFAWSGPPP